MARRPFTRNYEGTNFSKKRGLKRGVVLGQAFTHVEL